VRARSLVPVAWLMGANRFVWYIADTAFDAIVNADLAYRAESFVVEGWDAQRGAQFFVELSQVFEMRGERGKFQTIVGQKKFLVTCVPKPRKPTLQHDRRRNRHLIEAVCPFAEFRATAVLLDAHNAAGAADGKAQRRQAFDLLWCKSLFDIPHGALSVVNADCSVKLAVLTYC
jgi:hypothetical protein